MDQKEEMAIEVRKEEYVSAKAEATNLMCSKKPIGRFEMLECFKTTKGIKYFLNSEGYFKIVEFLKLKKLKTN